MRNVLRFIDAVSEYTGRVTSWICAFLVLVLVYESTARYLFHSPTLWAHQFSTMLGATIASLGWAYTHRHHGHVRVDVIYSSLSPKVRATIDVFFALLFFFPLFITTAFIAEEWMIKSWQTHEIFTESLWYPPAGPVRTIVFFGLCLFVLQGLAQFVRDAYFLIRSKPL